MGTNGKNQPKLIVIIGPTSSGKSDLAVCIARKLNGEVISADSRQIYKDMNIGTGKITEKEMKGVPHHLLDILSPDKNFSVAQYVKLAEEKINHLVKRKKIPIVCGGTGFYVDSLINKISLPKVSPDWKLRTRLEKKSTETLFKELQKLDSQRAKTIDIKNRRRLIRALEIIKKTKKPIPPLAQKKRYNSLYIGINIKQEDLNKKIEKRLKKRLKNGMIGEVEDLHKNGVSWKKLEDFGLEYKWTALYLQKKIEKEEMIKRLTIDIIKFSKRQNTWWKRNKEIHWINANKDACLLAKNFIHS